jgi:uncharacterized protein DUF2726
MASLPTWLGSRGIMRLVRIQPISTATEALGISLLRRTLSGPHWHVAPQVAIQSVLRKEEGLSEAAFSMFTRGTFDCVVYRSDDNQPVFAVEFDGIGHEKPRQVERDQLKNLFCMAAGLPLLRLGTNDLIQQERLSILEWLSQALIDWVDGIEDEHELGGDAESELSEFEPPREVDEGFDLDEEEGPVFETAHPFPANAVISERLLRLHKISIGSPLAEPGALPRIVMDSSFGTSRYVLSIRWPGRRTFEQGPASEFVVTESDFTVHDRNNVIRAGVGRGRFAWAHRLPGQLWLSPMRANTILTAGQLAYRLERGLSPTNLGWWESAGVARELALYDVLSQVELWAQREMPAQKVDVG